MDKTTRNKIILSASLFALLFTSKFAVDKVASNANKKIISWGQEQTSEVQLVAHRGFSSMYYDNTVEGILAANKLKCIEGIEVDVRLSKDNELVLMHNDYINGFNRVYNYTLEELRGLDLTTELNYRPVAFKGYSIKEQEILAKRYEYMEKAPYTLCTLEECLKNRDKSKTLFIDIKFSGYNDDLLILKIGELIKGEENVIIQSFSGEMLRKMLEIYPDYNYQLLIDTRRGLDAIDYFFDSYGIKYSILGEDTIEDLMEHDKQVSLWTVDSYKDFKQLIDEYGEYNDDIYYISNNPDMLAYQYAKTKHK